MAKRKSSYEMKLSTNKDIEQYARDVKKRMQGFSKKVGKNV